MYEYSHSRYAITAQRQTPSPFFLTRKPTYAVRYGIIIEEQHLIIEQQHLEADMQKG